jgi:hypothetical protein
MNKVLIYIVAIAIIILLGVDAYLAIAGKATAITIVELAVGVAAIFAFAAAAFVRTIGGFSFPWRRKTDADDESDPVNDRLDEIITHVAACCDSLSETRNIVESTSEDLLDRLGPKPDAWEATVNTVDEYGKLVPVYSLKPEDTRTDALEAAQNSIEARDAEGNTVENAHITLRPIYYPGNV